MNKKKLFAGTILGFAGTILGCYIYLSLFTKFDFNQGVSVLKSQGSLGKLITLGSIVNLILFGILLKLNQDLMARGIVLSVIMMAIVTMFI
ncbi:hypothetical protein H8R23_05915 [Flavobacterium sp. F-380]|uniref:Uncharacterized protein n=1 Tax=Flavobacterium kayseriense TaxID=2764714 RepID=A0ABR7J5Y8_9FLAO|nr:hypothetical protein [Flavobacterium kayseriense]MBC5840934.1 hypothetical protein [Flavobacterium kayseriense]MBC5846397.1 hypothetical protein [Flavobacterium kayseriense]